MLKLLCNLLLSTVTAQLLFGREDQSMGRNRGTGAQNITQMGNYSVIFDQDSCELRINHTDSRTEIYRALVTEIAQVGHGDIDSHTQYVIQDGNIAYYPSIKANSTGDECPTFSVNSANGDLSVEFAGEQKLDIGTWLTPSEYTVPTQVRVHLSEDGIGVVIEASYQDDHNKVNLLSTNYESPADEEIYGLGLQYTEWNFKGKSVPIVTAEGGIGRGLQSITFFTNLYKNSGGTSVTSYAPSYSYVTNKRRSVTFNSTAMGHYEFSQQKTKAMFWHEKTIYQTVVYGESIKKLAAQMSRSIGTMKALPDWIMNGAIVSLQGGQKQVNATASQLINANVPIVAFWMQDWVGTSVSREGERLQWNWKLNREHYPQWDEMKEQWAQKGIKPFIYINPYFSNVSAGNDTTNNQFTEAIDQGLFIKNQDDTAKMFTSGNLIFGCVDLTNPDSRKWVKNIIQKNMIEEAGAWGWMHDFGEYVSLDSKTYDGIDPIVQNHNNFPYLWAEIVKEAIEESQVPHAQEIVPFMRSGSTRSPSQTRLFWMGDQLPTFDQYDGLWSAVIGQLNGGLSGFTLGHSDIGGYTTVSVKDLYSYTRSKELLLRWIESNTFSDMIMRTHIGLIPNRMYQIWDDAKTTEFFSKFVNIHKSLKNYKMQLMKENEIDGVAPLRSLLVEFEDDDTARRIKDQFMLGTDLMMAPIVKAGETRRNVYMPKGLWTHYFTKKEYDFTKQGGWLKQQSAPLGQPLVFVKGALKDTLLANAQEDQNSSKDL